MIYEAPSIETLKQEIALLNKKYQGNHNGLVNDIQLLEKELGAENRLSLAILIYGWLKISAISSPGKKTYLGIFSFGSDLAALLQSILKISHYNILQKENELIYLSELYTAIKNHSGFKLSHSRCSDKLCEEIEAMLRPIVSDSRIDDLLNNIPSEQSLKTDFSKLPEQFRTLHINLKKHTSRNEWVDLIEILEPVFDLNHSDNTQMAAKNKENTAEIRSEGFLVRFGLLLFIMTKIEAEYRISSPENSSLYRYCQSASLLNRSTDIAAQKHYFLILAGFMQKIKAYMQQSQDDKVIAFTKSYPDFFTTFEKELLTAILNLHLQELDQGKHPHLAAISSIVNAGTQCGVNLVMTAAVCSVLPTIPSLGISSICAYLGSSYYGVIGKMIGDRFGRTAEEAVLKGAVGAATMYPIQGFVQNTLGTTAANVAYAALSIPASIYTHAVEFFTTEKKPNAFANSHCVKALLDLPDKIFSADKKLKLQKISIGTTNDASKTNEEEAHATMSDTLAILKLA